MTQTHSAISRRHFLKSMAAATAAAQSCISLRASVVQPVLANADACSASQRLDSGWEYYRGALDGPWEVWHGDEIAAWEKVTLPHCFNHYDACDPDTPYYRGHGWYRTLIPIVNPIDERPHVAVLRRRRPDVACICRQHHGRHARRRLRRIRLRHHGCR